ncbi:hypothetical protein JTB14_025340 [Gonioctena quinquepunctata]|nr:hypothetical protein JTB14_025340 [Gonioctena quinquepunctata]
MPQREEEYFVEFQLNSTSERIPLETIEDLQKFDSDITELEEMQKSFVTIMKSIGGKHVKNNINRCLSRLFSNQLATQCSWYGQRGNFKLSNLNVMRILRDVMLHEYKDITIYEVEKYFAEWFRHSRQRLQREIKF